MQRRLSEVRDPAAEHPDVAGVEEHLSTFLDNIGFQQRLQSWKSRLDETTFGRLRQYQQAALELAFSCRQHLRSLALLRLLFVDDWPAGQRRLLQELGLQFVPQCQRLQRRLVAQVAEPTVKEFLADGCVRRLGERLRRFLGDGDNASELRRLGLSFGYGDSGGRRRVSGEDQLLHRLTQLCRRHSDFRSFFDLADASPLLRRRGFRSRYADNVRFVTTLGLRLRLLAHASDTTAAAAAAAAAAHAADAAAICRFAAADSQELRLCAEAAEAVANYVDTTGVRLLEMSRQLGQSAAAVAGSWGSGISLQHLHTKDLVLSCQVSVAGAEAAAGCHRLLVFSEFLLIVSESDDGRGGVRYQPLRRMGSRASVDGLPSLSETTKLPPVIPADCVLHAFADVGTTARERLPGESERFRVVAERRRANGARETAMVEFLVCAGRPRWPILHDELAPTAADCVRCILGVSSAAAGTETWARSWRHHRMSAGMLPGAASHTADDKSATQQQLDDADARGSGESEQQGQEELSNTELNSEPQQEVEQQQQQPTRAKSHVRQQWQAMEATFQQQASLLQLQRRQLQQLLLLGEDEYEIVLDMARESGRPSELEAALMAWDWYSRLHADTWRLLRSAAAGQADRLAQAAADMADSAAAAAAAMRTCALQEGNAASSDCSDDIAGNDSSPVAEVALGRTVFYVN